ncbi:hypothetical protein Q9L42_020785 (plasmid) [Methylomarinum sp. Ch1-1]|uniref:Uncharacterized protein n=1 Tax=Methylomarinum roseum TaxID=3067653 RepID=A0AAU7P0I3_9GAMM
MNKIVLHNFAIEVREESGRLIAIMPSLNQARRVANYASSPHGGYNNVFMRPSCRNATHQRFEEWM